MIPAFDYSGVLPPFLGSVSTLVDNVAPYETNILELVQHFSTSPERVKILNGLLRYRLDLFKAGFSDGFQWLDGSFVEDCERIRGCAPNDIDLVNFLRRPANATEDNDWQSFFPSVKHLFQPQLTKKEYSCDAYNVDLCIPAEYIVTNTSYWFGVFSHQKTTYQWKGMLRIPMYDPNMDPLAKQYLDGIDFS